LDYREALELIFRRSNFERGPQPPYGERTYRLTRMAELLEAVGNPHNAIPAIHVAGTKGKGSVTAMLESILRAAGYRTGMYTSPHLHTFRERVRLNGQSASEEQVVAWMRELQHALEARPNVTVFEAITALAMLGFREAGVDIAVYEVGMGGRLDATNVLQPRLTVITPVSLDHMGVLGDTIAAIAREKAGIIKEGVTCVSSPQQPDALAVLRAIAAERRASLCYTPELYNWQVTLAGPTSQTLAVRYRQTHHTATYQLPLLGEHQAENAVSAMAAAQQLRQQGLPVSEEHVAHGLAQVDWPGRLEVLSANPLVVVDGAHNGHSLARLFDTLPQHLRYDRLVCVFGVSSPHTPYALLEQVAARADQLILTQSVNTKAQPVADLAAFASERGMHASSEASVPKALASALASYQPGDLILVTGSLFVVAEARRAWLIHSGQAPPPDDPEGVY